MNGTNPKTWLRPELMGILPSRSFHGRSLLLGDSLMADWKHVPYSEDSSRWRRIFPIPSRVPHSPGCYAVYIDGELVYIGQSVNLHLRLRKGGICRRKYTSTHFTPWGEVSVGRFVLKVAYSRKYGDWAMRELRLLRRLKPKFNTILYAGKESAHG